RRATRKATAPAGAPQAAEVEAEPVVAEAEAEAEAPAPRGRTRRRASAPAGAPQAAEVEAGVTEAAQPEVVEAAEEEAPAPRARRRATRKATAPAGAPQAAPSDEDESATEAGESLPESAVAQIAAEEPEVAAAEKAAGRGRTRRRAASAEFTAGRPETQARAEQAEPPARGRRAARPAVPTFQAPVFTEPMFQTPETAAAAAAAAQRPEPEIDEDEHEAVAEAPAEPAGRRRRRRRGESAEVVEAQPVAAEEEAAEEVEPEQAEGAEGEAEEYEDRPSRRRRRGGRRRRRGEAADTDESAEEAEDEGEDEGEEEGEEEAGTETPAAAGTSSSRRRRRRRRRSGDTTDLVGEDEPERTVVKVREPRAPRKSDEPSDEVQSIKGSTRLEAKKQRRREGREQGRRRVPIITEAEFLARREAVERVMVVRQHGERTQIGVLEDDVLVEHYVNKEQATSYVGNVYLGKVQNVLPSMEAAFVDIGKGRNAVLYAGEVNFEALGMANGPRRIESALKSGQSVLVQVTKDPIGHKGARLTSQVSLPGRYLVYVPEGSMTGISRKLPDTERARLKTILKKIVPEDAGVIVRTAAEGASEDELRRDVERLQAQWEEIQKKSKMQSTSSPSLLYGEPDMTVRVVRDIFNEDFTKVVVSGDEAWETIHGYVSHVAPDLADRLERWTSEVDVFAVNRIDEQLMKALDRKVWLPSGGSLVIDKTEAMVVIDVNTGKFTGQGGNLEETVTRNNLEAAEEIVRQLRLRDLGGIVVVDFIDMVLESNRDLVMRRLLECLGRDRTKHQVAEVTSLGLIQMTRKRVGQGLLESFSETCVHCNGRGVIVHMEQPSAVGGGGKRSKKRGRGGAAGAEHVHEYEVAAEETEAEVVAEAAAPVALPEPAFAPDEELYSSAAEAEAAATRGRGRRRATRKVSAPAGAPQATEVVEPVAEPVAPAEPEPERAVVSEAPAEAEPAQEAAPTGRTRRRATRRASAPAGSPASSEPVPAETTIKAPEPETLPEPEVVEAAAAPAEQEAPVVAPPRARRRVTRKVTAPAGSPSGAEEAAVVVVAPAGAKAEEPAAEQVTGDEAGAGAPARKAARKTAKKATAKKAAVKKTAAKKTTTAKKTAAKKVAKKTVAAEQTSLPEVSADAS
ncbi:Rne/Rng family ribonuclease, partial [Streptomyces sp. NPDC002187]|uniref:Rne/Rng family ribonuclease n=1 Tax=Streptomyces sp. NPDC002187 TaxID=3364637 RepID=UPI0036A65DE3